MTTALSLCAAAALGSTVFAAPLRRLAVRHGCVDVPGGRKEHSAPTPLLGGVAIFGTVAALGLTTALAYGHRATFLVLGGASLVFAVGMLDDLQGTSVREKIAVQLIAAALVIGPGLRLRLTGQPLLDVLVTAGFIVVGTNAINLLDNMDGLAAGLAAAAAGAFLVVALSSGNQEIAVLAGIVAGASAGFLPHNFPRARMFMGDAGSLPLGFLLCTIAVMLSQLEPPERRFVPIAALALPLIDTGLVITSRLRRGVNPLKTPGSDHVSHRLARALGTRGAAVLACWGFGGLSAVVTTLLLVR